MPAGRGGLTSLRARRTTRRVGHDGRMRQRVHHAIARLGAPPTLCSWKDRGEVVWLVTELRAAGGELDAADPAVPLVADAVGRIEEWLATYPETAEQPADGPGVRAWNEVLAPELRQLWGTLEPLIRPAAAEWS